ncbi:hypothetical protein K2X92_03500 [Candidatus Gracilibacteria bacterium]|nr:hypothetical protein [Candidatus Gracilibacteria bacterium]
MKIYGDDAGSIVKNRYVELGISISGNEDKEAIVLNVQDKITQLLELFNTQILETIAEIEVQKKLKKSRLKHKIEKIRQKLRKSFSKKQVLKEGEISKRTALNCATLLELSKRDELGFPPIFANLILNPDETNGGTRILTLGIRSEDSGKTDLQIENLIKQTLSEIPH